MAMDYDLQLKITENAMQRKLFQQEFWGWYFN